MRKIVWLSLIFVMALPVVAAAQTPTRCGFSFGVAGGIGLPTDADMTDEFPYMGLGDLEVKWYLWKPLSLSGGMGFLYTEGLPTRMEWHDDWIDLASTGTSFWRSAWLDMILRVEIGRYWRFNPYVGGGAGYLYNTIERRGTYRDMPVRDYYAEFLPQYVAVAGYDFFFDQYVAMKMEARWKLAPTDATFVDGLDQGTWQALVGIQIYL